MMNSDITGSIQAASRQCQRASRVISLLIIVTFLRSYLLLQYRFGPLSFHCD